MIFFKKKEYCNKILHKQKELLMSVHSVRNINLFFPQMNQSKETHFELLHPHNKLVQTITMGTQVVKQGY
jgi:hypothetical protein